MSQLQDFCHHFAIDFALWTLWLCPVRAENQIHHRGKTGGRCKENNWLSEPILCTMLLLDIFKLWDLIWIEICLGNSGIAFPKSHFDIYSLLSWFQYRTITPRGNIPSQYRKERTHVNLISEWILTPQPYVFDLWNQKISSKLI